MKNTLMLSVLFPALLIMACGSRNDVKDKPVDPKDYKKTLMNVNQKLAQAENEQIESYIARYHWKMETTGTGLRYYIYKNGTGAKPEKGKYAQIRFKVNLINGQVVYDSKTDGMKSFEIGKAQVESGLEEGIMLMRAGDQAKLIIPSHLAFGLLGDDNKIPKRATLIYDVELVSVF